MKHRWFLPMAVLAGLCLSCGSDPGEIVVPDDEVEVREWLFSTPGEQGLDDNQISAALIEAERREFITSILIVKNGFLVAERYYGDFSGQFYAHDIRSVTKSFVSALVGLALERGHLTSLEQKLMNFFPEFDTPNLDPRKRKITIRHLLTMTAGFDYEGNIVNEVRLGDNWVKAAIEQPLVFEPGAQFRYNSLESHLLSAILTKATGMSTYRFGKEHLFEPLRIQVRDWITDPQGYFSGGAGMFFTARDLAAFGLLYLNNGAMVGNQILSANWIAESVKYQIGGSGQWGDLSNLGYGFKWWVGKIAERNVYLAIGYGGQFIINFPDLNMLIVTTAETPPDWNEADQQGISILSWVSDHILPAVKD